jgi:hypothetical protein
VNAYNIFMHHDEIMTQPSRYRGQWRDQATMKRLDHDFTRALHRPAHPERAQGAAEGSGAN